MAWTAAAATVTRAAATPAAELRLPLAAGLGRASFAVTGRLRRAVSASLSTAAAAGTHLLLLEVAFRSPTGTGEGVLHCSGQEEGVVVGDFVCGLVGVFSLSFHTISL